MGSQRAESDERARILIVPGDLLGPERADSFLGRDSLSVRTALDATQGLAAAELWRPHLVVFRSDTDDDADFRFCQALRKVCPDPVPKLLVVTDRLTGQLPEGGEAPFDGHLVSPVGADELLATIAELLRLPRRGSERVPLGVLVHADGFADESAGIEATLGTALTVSERGLLLEASRQLGLGTRGRLQFFLPESSERLTLEAEVRVAVDELRLRYVLEFLNLAPQHRALLRRHVDLHKA